MNFHIEYEQENDGRWLAEIPEIPGVLTYGATANEAMAKAEVLALRVLEEIGSRISKHTGLSPNDL